jgi:hypothetical protein
MQRVAPSCFFCFLSCLSVRFSGFRKVGLAMNSAFWLRIGAEVDGPTSKLKHLENKL